MLIRNQLLHNSAKIAGCTKINKHIVCGTYLGLSGTQAAATVSVMSGAEFVGRIALGYVAAINIIIMERKNVACP